jgi:hypothetical protein
MMKAAAVSLIAATLYAGAVLAQPPPSPAGSAHAPASPSAPKTVEGLTVTPSPLPTKECSPRDRRCIAIVVAELKRLYPQQLKRFCFQREMRTMNNSVLFSDVDPTTSSNPAQLGATYHAGSALGVACAPDKK